MLNSGGRKIQGTGVSDKEGIRLGLSVGVFIIVGDGVSDGVGVGVSVGVGAGVEVGVGRLNNRCAIFSA